MPFINCCGRKRFEVQLGWTNRKILVIVPYFVIGYVTSNLISHESVQGLEAATIITNVLFLIASVFAIAEVHRDPVRWHFAVFTAHVVALIASITLLLLTFGHLKESDDGLELEVGHQRQLELDSATEPPHNSSDQTAAPAGTDTDPTWTNWKSCMELLILSLALIGNTTASRFIRIPKSSPEEQFVDQEL